MSSQAGQDGALPGERIILKENTQRCKTLYLTIIFVKCLTQSQPIILSFDWVKIFQCGNFVNTQAPRQELSTWQDFLYIMQ